jgi:mxaC protein
LWSLLLLLLPLLVSLFRDCGFPALRAIPTDTLSRLVSVGITTTALIAFAATVLGLAGPYRVGQMVERLGTGSNIIILIDRSDSMNTDFAGRQPTVGENSMATAASRLLREFVDRRQHDRFGVAGFSTAPMMISPLTHQRGAVLAAIDAMDSPGLSRTNVGLGLALAQSMFPDAAAPGSRAILLVSDGAAVVDPKVQERLRIGFAREETHLYWLFLRAAGNRSIYDLPTSAQRDTPQAMPERHLDLFFKSLGVPYRAFEAESPDAIEQAIQEIASLESDPFPYLEKSSRVDLTGLLYTLATFTVTLLIAAKWLQTDIERGRP